jgi:ribosomal protein L7/L12
MFSSDSGQNGLTRRLLRIERLLEAIAARLEITPEELEAATRPRVSPAVADLAARGKKIAAIKLLREEQRLDLATAKQIVDEL